MRLYRKRRRGGEEDIVYHYCYYSARQKFDRFGVVLYT
jgi:hypothetical protein